MKRLGMPVAAVLAVALIALIAMSWLINRDALRRAVADQIHAVTGLDLTINGAIDVSVFPGSYVSFHNVGLKAGNENAPALQVDVLTANLRLLPLLLRRFEIADLMLLRPHIQVRRDVDGRSNWTPFIETIAHAMKPGSGNQLSFSEIRVQDGELNFDDAVNQLQDHIGDIDLSLAWPSISKSFAATGQFDWRGERVDGSISVSDFPAALSGERSGLKTRVTSAPLKVAFDGAIANRASLLLEGTLTADSPSLRNTMRWVGAPAAGNNGLGRFALKARANMVGSALALTNVNVELDGNVAEGVMTYTNNGRPSLQGTLAAGAIDFTPYISTVRLLASGAHDWNRQLFDLNSLSSTDLDLRLSAAQLTVGATKVGRTALGASLRAGTLQLSVAEAQLFGGTARGSFGISRAETAADVKTQFQLIDVDLQTCISELFGVNKLSGHGNLSVSLEATGSSPFGLAQSLDGNATLTGHDGAINGFNAEALLKRLERSPLSGGGNFRTGSTPFNNMTVAVKFSDGVATAEDIRVEGTTTKLTLTGTTSVPSREYDLKGVASLISPSVEKPGFDLPFIVQGPWDDPLIFPDPDSLIRRSPASAPLLDAVKDRKTRDAVRSVLERFTGQKLPPEAPATTGEVPKAN